MWADMNGTHYTHRTGADRGGDWGGVGDSDEDKDGMENRGMRGEGKDILRAEVGTGLTGSVVLSGRILNVVNADEDDRFVRFIDGRVGMQTRSILCIPIIVNIHQSGLDGDAFTGGGASEEGGGGRRALSLRSLPTHDTCSLCWCSFRPLRPLGPLRPLYPPSAHCADCTGAGTDTCVAAGARGGGGSRVGGASGGGESDRGVPTH
jgi:hypothetical protein